MRGPLLLSVYKGVRSLLGDLSHLWAVLISGNVYPFQAQICLPVLPILFCGATTKFLTLLLSDRPPIFLKSALLHLLRLNSPTSFHCSSLQLSPQHPGDSLTKTFTETNVSCRECPRAVWQQRTEHTAPPCSILDTSILRIGQKSTCSAVHHFALVAHCELLINKSPKCFHICG